MTKWRDISGYEGLYQVSDEGEVRSLDRTVPRGENMLSVKGRILKQGVDKDGRKTVSLWKNNKGETARVNRLVALAFIPNPDNLPVVDHRDQNPSNNHIGNLRWATSAQNSHNSKAHKDSKSGIKGVSWYARDKNWAAQILVKGRYLFLGRYKDIKDAISAVKEARKNHHGEFANHGSTR